MNISHRKITQELIKKYGIPVNHARYRENGKWYHNLTKFPSAFLDNRGYLLFQTEEEYKQSPYLQFGKDVHVVLNGISSIPGYKTYQLVPYPATPFQEFSEGGTQEIILELQKRDSALKRCAIDKYGLTCQICGFNFEHFYGALGAGYIEMHHIQPLSGNKAPKTTKLQDVTIVCSNCHRVLHRKGGEPLSIIKLKLAIEKRKSSNLSTSD